MAVTVNRTIPDALDGKIKDNTAGWGTQAAWWQWVKDITRQEIKNKQLRIAITEEEAALEIRRQAILGDTTLEG